MENFVTIEVNGHLLTVTEEEYNMMQDNSLMTEELPDNRHLLPPISEVLAEGSKRWLEGLHKFSSSNDSK